MKGHVKVELKDKNGKIIKETEQDNLITNAVPSLLAMYASLLKLASSSSSSSSSGTACESPLANFGGIHVFGDTLDEDKNSFNFPLDKEWLGFGKQINNTANPTLGTFVSSESVTSGDEIKLVWDFSSTQCIGTIKALALTNGEISQFPAEENPYCKISLLRSITVTKTNYTYLVFTDDDGYFYRITNDGTVYKDYIPFKGNLTFDIEQTDTLFKTLPRTCYNYTNGFDGYIYGIIKESSNYNIYRYKVSDLSFDEELYVSVATSDISVSLSSNKVSFAVKDGTVLLCCTHFASANAAVYTITSTGTVTKEDLTLRDIWQITSDTVIVLADEYVYKMDIATKEMKKLGSSSSYYYYYYCGNKYGVYYYYCYSSSNSKEYYAIGMDNLATICNLETPIEKTSDNSLRITYTLKMA